MDLEAEGETKSRYLRGGIWPFAGTVIYQSHSTNGHQWRSARRLQDKTSIRLSSSFLTPLTRNSTPQPISSGQLSAEQRMKGGWKRRRRRQISCPLVSRVLGGHIVQALKEE